MNLEHRKKNNCFETPINYQDKLFDVKVLKFRLVGNVSLLLLFNIASGKNLVFARTIKLTIEFLNKT